MLCYCIWGAQESKAAKSRATVNAKISSSDGFRFTAACWSETRVFHCMHWRRVVPVEHTHTHTHHTQGGVGGRQLITLVFKRLACKNFVSFPITNRWIYRQTKTRKWGDVFTELFHTVLMLHSVCVRAILR